MKSFKTILLAGMALLFICAAPGTTTYILSKEYTVTIHGTSNLHSWDETVETISGYGSMSSNSDGSMNLDAVSIKMEVHSIKSDMGSMMNSNTYKALKADANPQIIFTLASPLKSIQTNPGSPVVTAKGNLTIAGVTKPVEMKVKIFLQGQGKLSFEGAQTVKMTDYGVQPPTALMGTLKTGNEITINFKTSFTAKTN